MSSLSSEEEPLIEPSQHPTRPTEVRSQLVRQSMRTRKSAEKMLVTIFCILLVAIVVRCLYHVLAWVFRLPGRFGRYLSNSDGPFQVVVLGDIGRSPRMQYHAMSITGHKRRVDIIGYKESFCHPTLESERRATFHPLSPPPVLLSRMPFWLGGPLKVAWQMSTLAVAMLWSAPRPCWIIVQNPPSIPALHVCYLVSILRFSKLMVDWHNYGFSVLAGTRGPDHAFVHAYRLYERFFGRLAPNTNLTVSHAMAAQLKQHPWNFSKPIRILHDRPASIYKPLNYPLERRHLLSMIPVTAAEAATIIIQETRLLVSSTSWTPDEDFSLLLDALQRYAAAPVRDRRPLLAVITGRGPQKAEYEQRIAELTQSGRLPGVTVRTAWLPISQYAHLLGCADLGVCLHRSTSGVDLPMKIVDMFGAGLPVLAYSAYESFPELVKDGVNGWGFTDEQQLANLLLRLLDPEGHAELAKLREGVLIEGGRRWEAEWDWAVGPQLGIAMSRPPKPPPGTFDAIK